MAYDCTSRKSCVWALDNTKPGLLPLKSWFSYPPQLSVIKKKKEERKEILNQWMIYYSRLELHKPVGFPMTLHCTSVFSTVCGCYLSSTIKKGRLSFPPKCFLRAVVRSEESSPLCGAKNENCCWFGVMILVGVFYAHMCPMRLSSHSGTGKYWSKRCMTSTKCSRRAQ